MRKLRSVMPTSLVEHRAFIWSSSCRHRKVACLIAWKTDGANSTSNWFQFIQHKRKTRSLRPCSYPRRSETVSCERSKLTERSRQVAEDRRTRRWSLLLIPCGLPNHGLFTQMRRIFFRPLDKTHGGKS